MEADFKCCFEENFVFDESEEEELEDHMSNFSTDFSF